MAAISLRFRAELRRRWRAWCTIGLIAGVLGGSVISVAAGARRTDSALGRFDRALAAPDVLAFSNNDPNTPFAKVSYDDIAKLPQVVESGRLQLPQVSRPIAVNLIVPVDPNVGTAFFRRKVLSGRLPDPSRSDETSVSFTLADTYGVGVGDALDLDLRAPLTSDPSAPPTVPVHLKIVGIEAAPTEFPPQSGTGTLAAWTTPAFLAAHPGLPSYFASAVRLRNGAADVPAFDREVAALGNGDPIQAFAITDQDANTQRSIHLQAMTLWLLGAVLAAVAALVIGQLLARQGQLESIDHAALRALGLTSGQLTVLGLLRALVAGAVGAIVATAVAYASSPLLPVGLARDAEPHPGFAFDATAIAIGVVATIVAVLFVAVGPAVRLARRRAPALTQRPSVVASTLTTAGAPPPLTTGARLALERGRGATAVPVRTSIMVTAVAIATIAGAVVFSGSLNGLLGSPSQYGVQWQAEVVTTDAGTSGVGAATAVALADPDVANVGEGFAGVPLSIRGHRLEGIAIDDRRGSSLMATILSGRLPARTGEVVLGTKTMRTIGVELGDTVDVQVAGTDAAIGFTVVGQATFPTLSDGLGLGEGAGFTFSGLVASLPPGFAPPADHTLVRFRDDVDRAAAMARLDQQVAAACPCALLPPTKPVDLVNFGRVQYLPAVLAGLVGGLGVLTLAHLIVSATRRRRRELALLQVLGFVPRQVRRCVAWQATITVLVACLVGVPLGIAAGRYAWMRFADQLGVTAPPHVPLLLTIAVVPFAAIVIGNLAAFVPSRVAVAARPAMILREE